LALSTDGEQMTAARPTGSDTHDTGRRAGRRRSVLVLAATAVVVLLADIGTKHLALATLEGHDPLRLLGGAVYLTLTRNSGAAFSLGSGHTWVFPAITVVVVGWIIWMARRLRSVPWAVSLGLVLGGALGNLTDRIFRAPGVFVGHVIDMVSLFDPYGRVWPVFNLADSALVTGVSLAVLLELTGRQRDGSGGGPRTADRDASPNAGDGQREPA
jgi:signal peptidase II